jgi:hypothetical protein
MSPCPKFEAWLMGFLAPPEWPEDLRVREFPR